MEWRERGREGGVEATSAEGRKEERCRKEGREREGGKEKGVGRKGKRRQERE